MKDSADKGNRARRWSGAGKTTLLTRVFSHLISRGLRVFTIKHAHQEFDLDTPGKDSWQRRQAGAYEVLMASKARFVLIHELCGEAESECQNC